jgi:ERAP1-like C-terminal domain
VALKDGWFTTPAVDGKEIALQGLGHTPSVAAIKEVILPFLFSTSPPAAAKDSVPLSDMFILAGSLSANRVARPLLWAHLRDNWDKINEKLSGSPIVTDRMVRVSLSNFADLETLEDIEKFFKTVSTKD